MPVMEIQGKTLHTVDVRWDEVYYTNCPLVSASNIDQELGWVREELQEDRRLVCLPALHARQRLVPPLHPQPGQSGPGRGLFPAIHVNADLRRTVLLGTTHVYEGGAMLVRAGDPIYRMKDLRGKRIGITKSLNTIKNDWWRIQEEQGIEWMLLLNDMTRDDVELVDFPYPDDWYDKPEMLTPMHNPSELWLKRDHKHDLAFRPLEKALLDGTVDAIYTQTGPFQHIQEATGQLTSIEDLADHPDWRLQGANVPATFTCTDVMAEQHPELVVALLKGWIKVGRWANEHKHAAAAILDKQTYYLDVEDTFRNIRDVDLVPTLSAQNLAVLQGNTDFMHSHGYIKNRFDVTAWAAPEFLQQAATELLEEEWHKRSAARLPQGTELADAMSVRLG